MPALKAKLKSRSEAKGKKALALDARTTLVLGIFGMFMSVFALAIFFQFWKPLILGSLLALLLQRVYLRILTWCRRDWLASFLICASLILLVVGPLLSLANLMLIQVKHLVEHLPSISAELSSILERISAPLSAISTIELNRANIIQYVVDRADGILTYASSTTVIHAGAWGDFLLDSVIALMTVYFMLKDGTSLKRKIVYTLKVSPEKINLFLTQISELSRSIIIGTFAASLSQALLIGGAFAIAKIPGALVASVVTFVFSFVPLLGSWPLTIVGIVYAVVQQQPSSAVIVLVGGLLAGICDNIVRVWLSADSENVHPLLILISILGGLNLLGASGVILGPLIVALVIQNQVAISSLLNRIYYKLVSGRIETNETKM